MKLWQIASYAQRQSLCEPVMPNSRRPFGTDEHKATTGDRWRML